MDLDKISNHMPMPSITDHMAPPREIDLPREDVAIVIESIAVLEKSHSKKEQLFEIFDDWQTKRTLTTKRVLVSTSVIVCAASWVGIDYMELSFFGLKISDGNPQRFLIFVLVSILLSWLLYEFSRRIDLSVKKAKIANVSQDLKVLKEPVESIDSVMERNNISSFRELYFDFESSLNTNRDAINAFNAVHFYRKHLAVSKQGLNILELTELAIIYIIAVYASVALVCSLV